MPTDDDVELASRPPPPPVPISAQPHCPDCGYNLAGARRGWLRCPECGREMHPRDALRGPPPTRWQRLMSRFRDRRPLLAGLFVSPAVLHTTGYAWPENGELFRNIALWGGPAILYGWACLWMRLRGTAMWGLFAVPFALAAIPANVVLGLIGAVLATLIEFHAPLGLVVLGGVGAAVAILLSALFANHAESAIPMDDYNSEP